MVLFFICLTIKRNRIMEEKKVYTIVYFKDGAYYMLSSNCFRTSDMAEGVAKRFCASRIDGSLWSYDIEELGCYE